MENYTRYELPCGHETGNVKDRGERIPDYHPLTVTQIEDLLRKAIAHDDAQEARSVNSVLCRLVQGIQGMECPERSDGPVSDKADVIREKVLACIKLRNQDIPTLAVQLHTIMG